MIPILPPSVLGSCFDSLHGCIRPGWELGLRFSDDTTVEDLPGPAAPLGSVLIHCHVFYPSLLPELILSWQHIPNRKVVLTTSLTRLIPALDRLMAELETCSYEIISVPNRGRDLAPLLIACRPFLSGMFDFVVHCHTKRSTHVDPNFSSGWRESLISATFSPNLVLDGILPLLRDPDTALIFPWPHNFVAHNVNWGENYTRCAQLMHLMCRALPRYTYLYFPAGSFFWIRTAELSPLLELQLRYSDFAPEPLPNDGSLAHAVERIVGLLPSTHQRKCYASWSGALIHGMSFGADFPALVQMPVTQPDTSFKDLFRQGFRRALEGENVHF